MKPTGLAARIDPAAAGGVGSPPGSGGPSSGREAGALRHPNGSLAAGASAHQPDLWP